MMTSPLNRNKLVVVIQKELVLGVPDSKRTLSQASVN